MVNTKEVALFKDWNQKMIHLTQLNTKLEHDLEILKSEKTEKAIDCLKRAVLELKPEKLEVKINVGVSTSGYRDTAWILFDYQKKKENIKTNSKIIDSNQ